MWKMYIFCLHSATHELNNEHVTTTSNFKATRSNTIGITRHGTYDLTRVNFVLDLIVLNDTFSCIFTDFEDDFCFLRIDLTGFGGLATSFFSSAGGRCFSGVFTLDISFFVFGVFAATLWARFVGLFLGVFLFFLAGVCFLNKHVKSRINTQL